MNELPKTVTTAVRFSRHRMVAESLFPSYRLHPFIFPWSDQRQFTARRIQERDRVLAHRRWKENYTFAPVETVWIEGICK